MSTKQRNKRIFAIVLAIGLLWGIWEWTKQRDAQRIAEIKEKENTIVGDTVVPVTLSDTAGMELIEIDSVKMLAAFQRAANRYSQAFLAKNAEVCAEYALPAMIKANGGIDKYKNKLNAYFARDPIVPDRVIAGPVERIGPKLDKEGYGHGWYCVMPVRRYITVEGKQMLDIQHMAGQTLDEGKHIYFIDITGMPWEKIEQVMPDIDFLVKK
jgi:hypothetical protein